MKTTKEQKRIFREKVYSRMQNDAAGEIQEPVRESAKWHMRHRPYYQERQFKGPGNNDDTEKGESQV